MNAAWVATTFEYDKLDRISSTELANTMRSELGYDGAGRVRTIISKRSGQPEETLTRTFSNGRLVSSVDSAFTGSESYAYDSAGRVSTITYPGGERRELGYDLRSRVTTERFIDAAEATILELSYVYDVANRITEIRRQPLNALQVKYAYTNGFVTQTDYGNGLRRTATINTSFGLPATSVTTTPQSQTVENTLNDYGNGFIIGRESTIAGTYHDEAYGTWSEWRLDTAIQNWNFTQSGSEIFQWDSLSNVRIGGVVYNAEANRLTQTAQHNYGYDSAGFVTTRDGVTLTYDATGAIASIGTVATFDHDLDGRPVSRTLNGVTKTFRFGGAIAYSTSGTPIELDLGEVVIKLDGTGNRYRHMDFRGNVLFQTNNSGTVIGQAVYRGFGRFQSSGNLGDRGFAGGFEVPSLGLVVLGPRVLDSDTGRFLSQDPVFNRVNQYAYAQGNPVFFWDPTGLFIASDYPTGGFSFSFHSLEFGEFGWGLQFGASAVGGFVGFDITKSFDYAHGTSLLTVSRSGDLFGGEADMDVSLFVVLGGLPALKKAWIFDINLKLDLSVKFFFDPGTGSLIGGAFGIGPGIGGSVVFNSEVIGN